MNEHDQLRKIQFTGKSSYIVSLPKGWIIEQGLKRGDQVNVSRQGSSVLEIKPINISNNKNQEEAIITVSNDIIKKLQFINYDLEKYSLDTVKAFYKDAVEANYKIN